MKKVCNKEAMVVLGLAVKANAWSTCVETILVRVVNSESHDAGILVNGVEAHIQSLALALVSIPIISCQLSKLM